MVGDKSQIAEGQEINRNSEMEIIGDAPLLRSSNMRKNREKNGMCMKNQDQREVNYVSKLKSDGEAEGIEQHRKKMKNRKTNKIQSWR